jgi:hypothetical protein
MLIQPATPTEYKRTKMNYPKLTTNTLASISNKPLINSVIPIPENTGFVRTPLSESKTKQEQGGITGDGLLSLEDKSFQVIELKTKDQLIEKIKEWVKIDNEIRLLQKEQKKRLADKKKVSGELMAVMRTNEIDAFDLNDGQILYDKRNQKKPITKTALLSILTAYYKGDAVKANETNQYILDNREEVVREKIVRKIMNPKFPKNAET